MFPSSDKKIVNNFISHNKKFVKDNKKKNDKIFLVEFNGWSAIHIIFLFS